MTRSQTLFGFTYDYVHHDGNYIQISREHVLTSDELTHLQFNMLQYNTVPHLLPCESEYMNNEVRLLYRFTHKRMLSLELRLKSLSIIDFYRVLYGIVSIILDNKAYMLDESKYVLHEDFIFVGKNMEDLYLCYLPIRTLKGKAGIRQELHTLAMKLLSHVDEVRGDHLKQLLHQFQEPHLSLQELRDSLFHLMEQANEQRDAPSTQEQTIEPVVENRSEHVDHVDHVDHGERRSFFLDHFKHLHFRRISYILCAIVFLFVVGIYIRNPQEGLFYICIGITILLIDALYIIGKGFKSSSDTVMETTVPDSPIPASAYYEHLGKYTKLLQDHPTVFLQQENDLPEHKQSPVPRAYLELLSDQESQMIHLTGKPFIIGRDREVSHYVIHSIGASRTHCEISLKHHDYIIKDLASSNGTYLNDEAIIPYKEYVLTPGDRIRIVNTEFVFCLTTS